MIMYLLGSLALYHTLFDKRLLRHPRFLVNQIKLEINQGISAIPVITLLTVPIFLAEIRGWSKLYDFTSESPFFGYTLLQYPLFICFTDSGIYWIHRGLHHPLVYRWLHKPHHKWAVPTPFASYAFHPLDGWAQSLPYHIFPMIFPLQKSAYLGLFVFVTMWTVLIREFLCLYFIVQKRAERRKRMKTYNRPLQMMLSTYQRRRSSTEPLVTRCTISISTTITVNLQLPGIVLEAHIANRKVIASWKARKKMKRWQRN
jgi:hypothetical protein